MFAWPSAAPAAGPTAPSSSTTDSEASTRRVSLAWSCAWPDVRGRQKNPSSWSSTTPLRTPRPGAPAYSRSSARWCNPSGFRFTAPSCSTRSNRSGAISRRTTSAKCRRGRRLPHDSVQAGGPPKHPQAAEAQEHGKEVPQGRLDPRVRRPRESLIVHPQPRPKRNTRMHLPCRSTAMTTATRLVLCAEGDAIARGYGACKRCRP
jgi:hypothetical protein